ncbi:tetratricopeptide repeat protein [Virgibacillus sp. YIM 98842]|uniref:tetratricopeptide repeat protein n=1 Tax=Virgibacillus sp. YIM 98842 TaxID=2663533 RepID=UPI0013DA9632|nr:tetratricopeptide repeat protein [Virgibacillus sp. YIM 98842]
MSTNIIFDIDEKKDTILDEENKKELEEIVHEFKAGHYPNVVTKARAFRGKYKKEKISAFALLVEAISLAQIGAAKESAEVISSLYHNPSGHTVDGLIELGELAFLSDYKLSRRILSEAVKRMENDIEEDRIKLARGYLVLGEAEENLEKFKRAVTYYKKGLNCFEESDKRDQYMILFLHFKLGVLHSTINKPEDAIYYLDKTIELAGEPHKDIKINSLVSIAKTYGSMEKDDKAYEYLSKAIPLLENSSLKNRMVHAEALTEMAFYYFNQSRLEEAIPYYEQAIHIYRGLTTYSARKIGMIYMQYAYCLEHKQNRNFSLAGRNYEFAVHELEKSNDRELLENALADVISFFDQRKNTKKKRYYENKFVKLTNTNADKVME